MKCIRLPVLFILLLTFWETAVCETPRVNIIYPKKEAMIGAVDSTFILGSVTPGSKLIINGLEIPVHSEGGFIAFLPIKPGRFEFEIAAVKGSDSTKIIWPVDVPVPMKSPGLDSMMIIERSRVENKVLCRGDRLLVEFMGTPGCKAYFSIPGLADSVPMTELPPQVQAYWGEALFGGGAVPESLKTRGHYEGFLDIGPEKLPDSSRICYYLVAPEIEQILMHMLINPSEIRDLNLLALWRLSGACKLDSSRYFVSLNPPNWPRMVEFTDSVQIIRVGPKRGYFSIFQPQGVVALAVGREGEWLKLKLSATQYGWVNTNSIKFLEVGRPPEISNPKTIRTFSSPENLLVEIPLASRHPFRIEEEDARTLLVYLYGVNSDTDWIRYDFRDKNLEIADWVQIEPELYRLRLKFKNPIWGYDAFYDGRGFKLQINKPPQPINNIRDKVIVVDPGHAADPGAIGPMGLKESEANLKIAQALKVELEKKGARVIMTRNDMSNLPLAERPVIARLNKADLFISIHNNALPDGVNPFVNNGVSTYYYHPHSIELAKEIQEELLKSVGLKDYGLYYGNLAVNRPTQYPAVLVECAFIILPEQEAMLKTDSFRLRVAKAIRSGIEKFLREYGTR
jgi:N-acetylmuramoyl-L-alanine amidase